MNLVERKVSEGIAILQLNSPKNLNALSIPMLNELKEAIEVYAVDENVKVLVISGTGHGFSAGGDIGSMLQGIQTESLPIDESMNGLKEVAMRIREIRKPVIASVHGPVAGAGFNLALLCDFRIAADNAKFTQAFINIGLVPDMGGTFTLTKILGMAKTTELVMTGRTVNADEAYSLGLVNQVVPVEELENATIKFAAMLSKKPSIALGYMKTMINNIVYNGLEESLDQEVVYQKACIETADFVEGVTAFAEKRKPVFVGK